jgi:hypothetical protein
MESKKTVQVYVFDLGATGNKLNCVHTFNANSERIQHFKRRISEKNLKPEDVAIVVINVDDPHGGPIADILMPNHNWQQYRDQGEVPCARGLVMRQGMQKILESSILLPQKNCVPCRRLLKYPL